MPTLDDLDQRLSSLENRVDNMDRDVSSLESQVSNNTANYQSANQRINQLSSNLSSLSNRHDTELTALETKHDADIAALDGRVTILEVWRRDVVDPTLADHEKRIHLLEYSHIKYTKTREVKSPLRTGAGIEIYMPTDLLIEDLQALNQGIGSQVYHWFTKIFNPNGYGKVSFDLDRRNQGFIKTITIGQNARVLIPTGLKLKFTPEKSAMKVSIPRNLSINNGLEFSIEHPDRNDQELIIGLANHTPHVIDIPAGGPIALLVQYFTYYAIPELITDEEFKQLNDNGYEPGEEP